MELRLDGNWIRFSSNGWFESGFMKLVESGERERLIKRIDGIMENIGLLSPKEGDDERIQIWKSCKAMIRSLHEHGFNSPDELPRLGRINEQARIEGESGTDDAGVIVLPNEENRFVRKELIINSAGKKVAEYTKTTDYGMIGLSASRWEQMNENELERLIDIIGRAGDFFADNGKPDFAVKMSTLIPHFESVLADVMDGKEIKMSKAAIGMALLVSMLPQMIGRLSVLPIAAIAAEQLMEHSLK